MTDEQARLAETLDAVAYEPPKPKRRWFKRLLAAVVVASLATLGFLGVRAKRQHDADTPGQAEDIRLLREHLADVQSLSVGEVYTWKRMRYAFASSDSMVFIRLGPGIDLEPKSIRALGFDREESRNASWVDFQFEWDKGPSWWQEGKTDRLAEAWGAGETTVYRRKNSDMLVIMKKTGRVYYAGRLYRDLGQK